jgi:hypothetical protein
MQLGGCADFLHPLIWNLVSGMMQFCDGSDKGTATMKLSRPGLSLVTRAGFMVMTLRQSNIPHNGKVQTHRDQKRGRQAKSKAKSMFIIFIDIKGIVHKEFGLAGQTVSLCILLCCLTVTA